MPYVIKAILLGFSDTNTKYDAIPISMYRMVQTIGKSNAGGDRGGLVTASNVCILFWVKRAESPPTKSGRAIQKINFFHCIFK